jgi:hypothetical protein
VALKLDGGRHPEAGLGHTPRGLPALLKQALGSAAVRHDEADVDARPGMCVVMQLNPREFDAVPEHVIHACADLLV